MTKDKTGQAVIGKNQRVLVTGGAGLVGSHTVDLLIEGENCQNCREIVVLDNFSRGRHENLTWAPIHGPVTIVEGDIRDREVLSDVVQGIDVLFPQAAIRITQCAEEPQLAFENLHKGKKCGAKESKALE